MTGTSQGHTQGSAEIVKTRDGRELYSQMLDGPEQTGNGVTVIFEAGAAASRSTWANVQIPVSQFARAVVYDRSGLGKSAPDPVGRTLDRMADDLVDVIEHFAPAKTVLVGHSAGGPIARLAASRRPELVSGLVLLDATDEAADELFGRGFRVAEKIGVAVQLILARLGLLPLLFRWLVAAVPAEDVRADLRREAFAPGAIKTMGRQAKTFLNELQTWRDDPPRTEGIPTTVICGARADAGMPRRLRPIANEAGRVRAQRATAGRFVVAAESGHYLTLTEPEMIASEIERIVDVAKQDSAA